MDDFAPTENESDKITDKLLRKNWSGTSIKLNTDVIKTFVEKPETVLLSKGYILKEKIGAGAFAQVYKAVRKSDNRIMACKVIDICKKKRDKLTDLQNELFVLEKIRHKNLVCLYDHFVLNYRLYIFIEYASGGTLSELVRREGPLSENIARPWFLEVTSALQHMHRLGISHRDLKLGNILLDASQTCKVTDFGLSRVSYKPSRGILYCTSCCGTEPYMAPEILRKRSNGTRLYDPMTADIWALGVCLYAMINKAYPFNPENKEVMILHQLQRKWKFVRKLRKTFSSEVKDLIRNLLEPNPRKRLTLFGIFSHPLCLMKQTDEEDT